MAISLTSSELAGAGEKSGAIWPTYRGNPQRTGQSPFTGPTQMRVKWEIDLGDVIVAAPVVGADGTAYLITGNTFSAVGPDGVLLWSHDLAESGHARLPRQSSEGYTPQSAVLGADGTLYQALGGYLACILAVNTQLEAPERLEWVCDGFETRSSPLLLDGTFYTGGREEVRAFDIGNKGEVRWRQTGPYTVSSSLALSRDGETLYVGGADRNLHALDRETGEPKWSAGPDGQGRVRLQERDAEGTTIRHFTTAGHVAEAPAVAPDGTIVFGSWDGHLYAAAEGDIQWSIDLKDRITSAPAIGPDGRILVSTFEGMLCAVRVDDGKPVLDWQAQANARYSSPLISTDGTVYVGTMDGRLRAYALTSGEKIGEVTFAREDPDALPGWITASPVPGGDGVLVLGSSDGRLRAIE